MAAPAERDLTEPVVSLTTEPYAANPRVRIVLIGRINGDDVADAFIRLYSEQPEATLYDRLFDFTAYRSGFELQHVQRIAIAYRQANPDPRRPCRTAFVTPDRNFGLWASSMGFHFKGRELRAFSNFDEAEAFLSEPLSERQPFSSD